MPVGCPLGACWVPIGRLVTEKDKEIAELRKERAGQRFTPLAALIGGDSGLEAGGHLGADGFASPGAAAAAGALLPPPPSPGGEGLSAEAAERESEALVASARLQASRDVVATQLRGQVSRGQGPGG